MSMPKTDSGLFDYPITPTERETVAKILAILRNEHDDRREEVMSILRPVALDLLAKASESLF